MDFIVNVNFNMLMMMEQVMYVVADYIHSGTKSETSYSISRRLRTALATSYSIKANNYKCTKPTPQMPGVLTGQTKQRE